MRTPQEDVVALEFSTHPEYWGRADRIYLRRPFGLRAAVNPAIIPGPVTEPGPPAAVGMGQELNRLLRPGGFVEFRLLRSGDRNVVYLMRDQISGARTVEVPETAIDRFLRDGTLPTDAEQRQILQEAEADLRQGLGPEGEGIYNRIIRITKGF
jgi:hypothetical protein